MSDSNIEQGSLDNIIDPDVLKIVKQLTGSLEYRQLCLDLLPEVDPTVDAAIDKALQPEPITSDAIFVPLDFVNSSSTQIIFPGFFDEAGTSWVNISVVEPQTGDVVCFKFHDASTTVGYLTKYKEVATPVGNLSIRATHWRPATEDERRDFDNLCAANKEAMEHITDLYA